MPDDFNANIGEYLRRKRLQDAMVGGGVATSDEDPEEETAAETPEEAESSNDESEVNPEEAAQAEEEGQSLVTKQPATPPRPSDPLVGQNASVEPQGSTQSIPQGGPTVQPPTYGPQTQAYLDQANSAPQQGDYKPSMFRRILAGIAGVGMGVGGGAGPAAEAAQEIKGVPFARANEAYQRNLASKGIGAGIEQGQISAASKQREEEARRQAELARREAEEARGNRYNWLTGPIAQQYKMEQLKVQHPGTGPKLTPIGANGLYDPSTKTVISGTAKTNAPKTPFELWAQQNPAAKAEEYPGLHKTPNEYSDFKDAYLQLHPGSNATQVVGAFSALKEPPQRPPQISGFSGGKAIALRPGDKVPDDFTSTQVKNQSEIAKDKQEQGQQAGKDALNYGEQYLSGGKFTGPGDEALQEKFFELAKPSSGFRMSQPQMNMLMSSRSWMDSAEGLAYHAQTGQWFPPQQRQQIVDTMRQLVSSKGSSGNTPAQHAVPKPGEMFNGHKVTKVTEIHK